MILFLCTKPLHVASTRPSLLKLRKKCAISNIGHLKLPCAVDTQKSLGNKSKFNNSCVIHTNAPHLTRKCRSFLEKSSKERGQIVKNMKACQLCLNLSHVGQVCPFEEKWRTCNVSGCNEYHSRLLHGCGISLHLQISEDSSSCSVNKEENTNNTCLLI